MRTNRHAAVTRGWLLAWLLALLLAVSSCHAGAGQAPPTLDPTQVTLNGCSDPLRLYRSACYTTCCDAHDVRYAQGGDGEARLAADLALYRCIVDAGYPDDAATMYYAVRAWGWTRFRFTSRKD